MMDDCGLFPWSENWFIENEKAWFVLGMHNILCCLNLNTNMCEMVEHIPNGTLSEYRLMSCCIKFHSSIYCLPANGSSIWVYDLDSYSFSEICINNSEKVFLSVYDLWEYDNKIFAVSIGLKQIIEINAIEKKVENYYVLCNKGSIARSVKVGTLIYTLSGGAEEIYIFDLITKKITVYTCSDIGRKFNTICFDGKDFWLSGYNKEIYVWNEQKNEITIITDFSSEFGIYSFEVDKAGKVDYITDNYNLPAFLYSAVVGEKVWFIPFQTNKIMYADKENHHLYTFEIDEEIETKESCLERTFSRAKYILEYIKEDRYLGLFSIKNNKVLEIDAKELKYEWCNYCFSDECLTKYSRLIGNVFYEENVWDRENYNRILHLDDYKLQSINRTSVGTSIYNKVMQNIT